MFSKKILLIGIISLLVLYPAGESLAILGNLFGNDMSIMPEGRSRFSVNSRANTLGNLTLNQNESQDPIPVSDFLEIANIKVNGKEIDIENIETLSVGDEIAVSVKDGKQEDFNNLVSQYDSVEVIISKFDETAISLEDPNTQSETKQLLKEIELEENKYTYSYPFDEAGTYFIEMKLDEDEENSEMLAVVSVIETAEEVEAEEGENDPPVLIESEVNISVYDSVSNEKIELENSIKKGNSIPIYSFLSLVFDVGEINLEGRSLDVSDNVKMVVLDSEGNEVYEMTEMDGSSVSGVGKYKIDISENLKQGNYDIKIKAENGQEEYFSDLLLNVTVPFIFTGTMQIENEKAKVNQGDDIVVGLNKANFNELPAGAEASVIVFDAQNDIYNRVSINENGEYRIPTEGISESGDYYIGIITEDSDGIISLASDYQTVTLKATEETDVGETGAKPKTETGEETSEESETETETGSDFGELTLAEPYPATDENKYGYFGLTFARDEDSDDGNWELGARFTTYGDVLQINVNDTLQAVLNNSGEPSYSLVGYDTDDDGVVDYTKVYEIGNNQDWQINISSKDVLYVAIGNFAEDSETGTYDFVSYASDLY